MKKTLWLIFAVLAFLGIVLYVGNVLVIGDHIGQIAISIGVSTTLTKWLILAWDFIAVILPAFLLFWCIVRNIYGYGELNIEALLESRDEQYISLVLKSIADQSESLESPLDRHNARRRCNYLLNSGNRAEKLAFLREYYDYCEEDTKKLTSRYAMFAAVSVILSPKSAGDALALLAWQCRIISSTLRIYGGRPSKMMVLRLYAKVLMHSFVAGSIGEVIDQFAFGAVDVKMLSFLTQAMAAVATCVRTASLTRYYINHGLEGDRRRALKESLKEVSEGIVEVIKSEELRLAWKKFLNCGIEIGKAVAQEAGKYAISIIAPDEKQKENTAAEPEAIQ